MAVKGYITNEKQEQQIINDINNFNVLPDKDKQDEAIILNSKYKGPELELYWPEEKYYNLVMFFWFAIDIRSRLQRIENYYSEARALNLDIPHFYN